MEAEQFVTANWPRLYFIRPDPFIVEERENLRWSNQLGEDAESDEQLMMISAYNEGSGGGLAVPSVDGIFTSPLKAKVRLEPGAIELKTSVTAAVRKRLAYARANPDERTKFENAPTQPYRRRATRSLTELLIRPFLNMPPEAFEENDVFDLLHATVPLAYCDFVLLDKAFKARADSAIGQLRALSARAPLARVFDGRPVDVERFLSVIEGAPDRAAP